MEQAGNAASVPVESAPPIPMRHSAMLSWRICAAQAALLPTAVAFFGLLTRQLEPASAAGPVLIGLAVAIGAIAVHLWLQRAQAVRIQAAAAICDNVRDYAAGVERQLSALRLSDALGQMAASWNQFLSDIALLQQRRGTPGTGDAERAIARYELRQLHESLDRLPIGLARVQADGRLQYANATVARLLRCDPPVGGASLDALLGGSDATALLEGLRQQSSCAVDRTHGDGECKTAVRAELVRVGTSGDALLFVSDTTPLREAERARDNFLYHVTHELRTPLTNIQAYVETLTLPDIADERLRKECYNVIVSETGRLSSLIEDILGIAQLEVGTLRMAHDDVDAAKLVRDVVQDHQGAAEEKGITLSLSLQPKVPKLVGDKHRLTGLVANLVGNAMKYTPSGGAVSVAVEHDAASLRICVGDTGIGIAESDRSRVFEKFYRVQRDEVAEQKGTGLGLAIAREVARLHGGDITLESELGKGSRFTLELPLRST